MGRTKDRVYRLEQRMDALLSIVAVALVDRLEPEDPPEVEDTEGYAETDVVPNGQPTTYTVTDEGLAELRRLVYEDFGEVLYRHLHSTVVAGENS